MKWFIKYLILLFVIGASVLFSSCSMPFFDVCDIGSFSKRNDDQRVLDAIDVLKSYWDELYDQNEIEDKYIEIINTRIVNINEDIDWGDSYKSDYFDDVDYIVEFEFLSNYYNSSPYYINIFKDNCVVVYEDGSMNVSTDLLRKHTSITYSSDYTPIIESIEDFKGDYDRVLRWE